MTRFFHLKLVFATLLLASILVSTATWANDNPFRSTNYPIPRFATTDNDEAFVRTGPGKKFPIKWVYNKRAIPVEIILEYDAWRKIRDKDGQIGWIHKGLLSGKRAGFILSDKPEQLVLIYAVNSENARAVAKIQHGAHVMINECQQRFCKVKSQGYEGWVQRNSIWGIYPNENFG